MESTEDDAETEEYGADEEIGDAEEPREFHEGFFGWSGCSCAACASPARWFTFAGVADFKPGITDDVEALKDFHLWQTSLDITDHV